MPITAQGKTDADALKALNNVLLFGKREPKMQLITRCLLFSILIAISIVSGIKWGFDAFRLCLLLMCAIAILLHCYLYFLLPKLRIRAMGELLGCINRYDFCEEAFSVTSDMAELNGTAQINYSLVKRVYETKTYLFLMMTNSTAYIVKKESLDQASQSTLRKVLSQKAEKYIFCNY